MFDRIFRSRPIDKRENGGIWRVGMLAVCVRDDWADPDAAHPRAGDVLRVTQVMDQVGRPVGMKVRMRAIWLIFEGGSADHAWWSEGFRPAVSDDRAADAEFTASLARPAKVPA